MDQERRDHIARQIVALPSRQPCPNCQQLVHDWHTEWYPGRGPDLYKGTVAMDCPICQAAVLFKKGAIDPVPAGTSVPTLRRDPDQAAAWARNFGTSLEEYIQSNPAGQQYAGYFTPAEIQQADAQRSP